MKGTAAAVIVLAILASSARGDLIVLRGSAAAIQGAITGVDDAGITLRGGSGESRLVPWDRVRRVVGEPPGKWEAAVGGWMSMAVELWRARSRVERNDTPLAEPLLERLFERYRGRSHETALVVAEGLLRCRLARFDHALAVIPALEVARLRRAGVRTDSYSMLPAVMDAQRALCTALAPAWLSTGLLASLEHDLAGYDDRGDEVVAALANLYRRAVRQTLGSATTVANEPAPDPGDHPGVALVELLVDCTAQEADRRRTARESLTRMVPRLPEWAEAWARFHIGLSLVGEPGIGRRQRGMVSLIHLPARFARSLPYLAGLALGHAAEALAEAGQSDAAATLRIQLQKDFPDHPIHAAGSVSQRLDRVMSKHIEPKEDE